MRAAARDSAVARMGSTDWFKVDKAYFSSLAGVPGIRFDGPGGRPIVHRSHLALLPAHLLTGVAGDHALTLGARGLKLDGDVQLRPHQVTGAEFLRARKGALLADQPRIGKTATSLASVNLDNGPLVVVAPLQAREVWLDWLSRMWPNKTARALTGRCKPSDPQAVGNFVDILFVHYELLPWRVDLQHLRVGTLILDEAHLISNVRSHWTQAVLLLVNHSSRVYALTGTPIRNRISGLYPVLAAIAPGAFGSYWDFCFRYCGAKPHAYGVDVKGSSHEDELDARLADLMLRRTWKDLDIDLPTIRTAHLVPLAFKQQVAIDLVVEEARALLGKASIVQALTLYRKHLGDLKIAETVALAKTYADEPVVIWTWHREVANTIGKALKTKFVVHGELSPSKREKTIAAWKEDLTNAPLVMTLAVGQVAIDLSHAKRCIFAEQDFNPLVIEQAEMRTFHPTRPMSADFVTVDHPVDLGLVKALREKLEQGKLLDLSVAEGAIDVIARAFGEDIPSGDFESLMRVVEGV